MKRISVFLMGLLFISAPMAHAQDAATEERLNQLSGKIEDLIAAQNASRKRITELAHEIENLREQSSKPTGNYAGQEDLKRLADSVKEVDRKRIDDGEKTRAELLKLSKLLSAPAPSNPNSNSKPKVQPPSNVTSDKPAKNEDVAEYTVKSGDKLSQIAQAYRDNNYKVSVDTILKANPGLVAEKMRTGQKILIPLVK